jgi:hypothetical protein
MFELSTKKISGLTWDQSKAVKDIKDKKNLTIHIVDSHVLIILCTVIYGAILGFFVKDIQILLNAIKIPLLFLLTLYIALPIIFIVDVLQGNKINLSQTTTLILIGFNNIAIILLAFTPLMLFFILTALDYTFIVILNIAICGFAGYFGIYSIYINYKMFYNIDTWPHSLSIGSFIIVFVGTQLAWTLRPFFHSYSEFIRPVSGNFYVALASIIQKNPGVAVILIGIFGLIAALVSLTENTNYKKSNRTRIKRKLSKKGIKNNIPQYPIIHPPPTPFLPTPTQQAPPNIYPQTPPQIMQ